MEGKWMLCEDMVKITAVLFTGRLPVLRFLSLYIIIETFC